MTLYLRSLCLLCLTLGVVTSTSAQVVLGPDGPRNLDEKSVRRPDEPVIYRLTVTPAPEPAPPLKYRLYPRWTELKPGNSVPMWYRALDRMDSRHPTMKLMMDNYNRWIIDDWQEMPVAEVREFLQSRSTNFANARIAAFREQTEWNMPLRNLRGPDTVNFLLGEFQEARHLVQMLSLRIQLSLMDGKFDEALDDLAICFRLARDVAEPETLINDLIGIAFGSITEENIRRFIGMPGSPNLYWALADLPSPLIDIRDAMAYETTLPERFFPWLKDPASTDRSAEQWQTLLADALRDFSHALDSHGLPDSDASDLVLQTTLLGLCLRASPQARADLVEAGHAPTELDKLPVGQLIAMHEHLIYETMSQSYAAAALLPYEQSQPRFKRLSQDFRDRGFTHSMWQSRDAFPITRALLPAMRQMKEAQSRRETMRAALMTVEAIRMHLVESDGELPDSLEEIEVVPVPDDPRTHEPFAYEVREGVAVLELPTPHYNQRFEIRVAEETTK